MRTKPRIKMCGLRSAELAYDAVKAGADWIGIIVHPESKRFVELEVAIDIAAATRAANGVPVAVFVNQTASQMLAFCQTTGISVVQLHGVNARCEHSELPEHYQRIYVCGVGREGLRSGDLAGLNTCDPRRDYVLFDHAKAGSGQTFVWSKLDYRGPLPMGIAGGLNSGNVGDVLRLLSPQFVDVSSGVERSPGDKDMDRIKRFIDVVRV